MFINACTNNPENRCDPSPSLLRRIIHLAVDGVDIQAELEDLGATLTQRLKNQFNGYRNYAGVCGHAY